MANLNFFTGVNYQKIFLSGSFDSSIANPNVHTITPITHDLEYEPNCRVWFTNASGLICPATPSGFDGHLTAFIGYSCWYQIYNTTLVIFFDRGVTSGPTVHTTIYYRIYLDAAA